MELKNSTAATAYEAKIEGIKSIGEKYGLPISDDDIRYSEPEDMWYITPYQGGSGFSCQDGVWWGENIDSYSVRFMENDWDMFDEIAKYLA